jgi:DNA helicase II / ATP-dependent DNA helicase PcrA
MNTEAKSRTPSFFSQSLNQEQERAVHPKTGVLVVCAGAGSGKTRVITARIANLILQHDVPATSILALTFTNKAAKEMKERVLTFLGTTEQQPYVGTFHSYCLKLLKSNSQAAAIDNFTLLDTSDQEKIIRSLLTKYNLQKKVALKQVLSFISRIKNEATNAFERESAYGKDTILRDLYLMYEQEKRAAHCLDFDDLLTYTLALFQNNALFKQKFQENIKHILVDEYQDTNRVQHALLKAMCQDDKNIFKMDSVCVVGDEDQSIYSWRGADVTNIINFTQDFPTACAITIDKNYRSVKPILDIANTVIAQNKYRNPKNLWSDKEAVNRVKVLSCISGYQEAEAAALFLQQAQESAIALKDHAILYRSHFQSRTLEEALIRYAIPYKIIGGIQFYDRQEIKDLLSYLRLIINPFDRLAFCRIINTPSRGLGDKFEQLFITTWQEQPFLDFKEIAQQLLSSNQLTTAKQQALKHFLTIFNNLNGQSKASEIVQSIIERTSYTSYLKDSFEKEEAHAKQDNIKELINSAVYFEEQTQQSLDIFLEEISLLQDRMTDQKENTTDYVPLMTFHAAKGLEFNTILLTGLEEALLPSAHALYQPETLEEERRLLYVGITRAKERLLISHAKSRYTYGRLTDQTPSRFLEELAHEHVQKEDCSSWNRHHFSVYFKEWLNNSNSSTTIYGSRQEIPKVRIAPEEHTQWKQHQLVLHTIFGQGIIEKIEEKSDKNIYLTIRFKEGIKKLDSSFVQTKP